jgi:hypothetical protein
MFDVFLDPAGKIIKSGTGTLLHKYVMIGSISDAFVKIP